MIDWTKPLQWHNGSGHQLPSVLIGKDGDKYVVKTGTQAWRYHAYPADGVDEGMGFITNVPPPPVWPKEAWIVTCSAGTAHLVREKVRCKTVMNSLKNLGRSVKVTPVTLTGPFDGPPSKS